MEKCEKNLNTKLKQLKKIFSQELVYIDLIEAKISDIVTERERRKCKMFHQVYLKGNKKKNGKIPYH